ncbi:hypothetical protein O3G_MSEX002097 [Manduca sexta]|uniref:Uncharacterized protein n=1 Tax=Manduca sexta TaxID=7130 RepID=A0A921YMT5_MANSE|nr:hypothetical protein O3G_MSEX002097 [Manduca sexta]
MKKIQSGDSFQRMNYLYQISKHVVEKNAALSSYYNTLMINLAKKSVLKIHPDIKRQVCKKCRCMLVNNVSAKMKFKSKKKSKIIEWTCNTCNTKKSFPADKNNQKTLWLEREEAEVKDCNNYEK